MQEQRRLQQPGDDVRPVDDPVEIVELAGVVEGVKDERDQAENVEVRTLGRGPASEQNVHADAEVDQRDQPQSGVERAIGGSQDQRSFHRHALPHQRVGGLGPNADAIELPLQAADVGDVPAFDGNQLIAGLDAGLLAGTVYIDALGPQVAAGFDPPNAVVRSNIFTVFLEIDPGKGNRRNAKKHETNCEKPRL